MTAVAVEASTSPSQRTAVVLALVAVGPAVIGAVAGWFAGQVIGAVVGFVVLGAAAAAVVWVRAGRLSTAGIGGRPADPTREARLYNLADGLCVSAGVKMPELRVLDAEGLNLAIVGRDAGQATIVTTSGLLGRLSRMELEGIVAVAVSGIRQGDVAPATVAAAAFGLGARYTVGADRDRRLDEGGVAVTRYPPGLVSAYEKLVASGTSVPDVPGAQAHLWLADPAAAGVPLAPYRTPLAERIDALNSL